METPENGMLLKKQVRFENDHVNQFYVNQGMKQKNSSVLPTQDSGFIVSQSQTFSFASFKQSNCSLSKTTSKNQLDKEQKSPKLDDELISEHNTSLQKNLTKMKTFIKKINKHHMSRSLIFDENNDSRKKHYKKDFGILDRANTFLRNGFSYEDYLIDDSDGNHASSLKTSSSTLSTTFCKKDGNYFIPKNEKKSNKLLQLELTCSSILFFFNSFFGFDDSEKSNSLEDAAKIMATLKYCLEQNDEILKNQPGETGNSLTISCSSNLSFDFTKCKEINILTPNQNDFEPTVESVNFPEISKNTSIFEEQSPKLTQPRF